MEHPLETNWNLWDHKKGATNYEKSTRLVGTFGTIEMFWKYFNNYPKPSKLFNNGQTKNVFTNDEEDGITIMNQERPIASISIFRENVYPKWEDPQNTNGGEFSITNFINLEQVDKLWELIILHNIGETNTITQYITGIRVIDCSNKEPMYRIEMWFSDMSKYDEIESFFRQVIISIEEMDPNIKIYFKSHSDAVESHKFGRRGKNRSKHKDFRKKF